MPVRGGLHSCSFPGFFVGEILGYGGLESAAQVKARSESEIALCIGYVAVPVALAHDLEFVAVESGWLALDESPLFGYGGCCIYGP